MSSTGIKKLYWFVTFEQVWLLSSCFQVSLRTAFKPDLLWQDLASLRRMWSFAIVRWDMLQSSLIRSLPVNARYFHYSKLNSYGIPIYRKNIKSYVWAEWKIFYVVHIKLVLVHGVQPPLELNISIYLWIVANNTRMSRSGILITTEWKDCWGSSRNLILSFFSLRWKQYLWIFIWFLHVWHYQLYFKS